MIFPQTILRPCGMVAPKAATPCIYIRSFGSPSNKKKKRKLKRKVLQTARKEHQSKLRQAETRALYLARLNQLHEAAKWKRILDFQWLEYDKNNPESSTIHTNGVLRQYMLRCEGWCPISALREMFYDQVEYWAPTATILDAYTCELTEEGIYQVKLDQGLWEECYQKFHADFVDSSTTETIGTAEDQLGHDGDEDDGPTTLLDNDEGIEWILGDSTTAGRSFTTLAAGTSNRIRSSTSDPPSQEQQLIVAPPELIVERKPVDMYEACDETTQDWKHRDEEDNHLLEQYYRDVEEGKVNHEDERYRYAMVRHRDITLEVLRGIEDSIQEATAEMMNRHFYVYQDTTVAENSSWFKDRPTYDSSLVWNPKGNKDGRGDVSVLENILAQKTKGAA